MRKKIISVLVCMLSFVVLGAENVISFTTTLEVGSTMSLTINAAKTDPDRDAIWIDLNGNDVKDEGEKVTHLDLTSADYIIGTQSLKIHGNVTEFSCTYSELTAIDISTNSVFHTLDCKGNHITSIDLSKNAKFGSLIISDNSLKTLDVTHNPELVTLECSNNKLSDLDLSLNGQLSTLKCSRNNLEELLLYRNPNITYLECHSSHLKKILLGKKYSLFNFDCRDNDLTEIDVSKAPRLTKLNVSMNQIKELNVTPCSKLEILECGDNQLTALNVTNNTNLKELWCYQNSIKSLDISSCSRLYNLNCYLNQLTTLDLLGNFSLTDVNCLSNQITALDCSHNFSLNYLNCAPNALNSLNLANGNNLALKSMDCSANDNLCIQVDEGFFPSLMPVSWDKDASSNYSSSGCTTKEPTLRVDIEDCPLYHISNNFDAKRGKTEIAYDDTLFVAKDTPLNDDLKITSGKYPASLFDIVAVYKDENNHDYFIPMNAQEGNKVDFKMPNCSIRITTMINIKENASKDIPSAIDYLVFHDYSSLVNTPDQGATSVDDLIMLKLVFRPNTWYAVTFPFNVSRITVKDRDDEYDILPCSASQSNDGNFYLKYISDGIEHDDFKSSWQFEKSIRDIQKNKAYIINFPSEYYREKEIVFYGQKQEINNASNKFETTIDAGGHHYIYRSNNSFQYQEVENAYILNSEGTYFLLQKGTYYVKPFMSYVHSIHSGDCKYAPKRLSLKDIVGAPQNPTNSGTLEIENTLKYYVNSHNLFITSKENQTVCLVGINGQTRQDISLTVNQEKSLFLESGIYILRTQNNQTFKIVIL